MAQSGNKGESSETYNLSRSLVEGKVHAGNADVDKTKMENNSSQNNIPQEYDSLDDILPYSVKQITVDAGTTCGISGVPTGFDVLDAVLLGLKPGSLITIGGASGIGKSAFIQNILRNVSVDFRMPTLLFSAEMNSEYIVNRLLSIHSQINHTKISTGLLTPDEWARFDRTIRSLENSPLYIENTHHLYVEDVRRVATNAVREKGIKLIVIDYLQMMYYKTRMNDNRYTEINSIICQLKSLAMELQVPVIVVSQINRNILTRDNGSHDRYTNQPCLSDLRDSGTIGEDSDVVMFVHRPEFFRIFEDCGNDLRNVAYICIEKNRFGNKRYVELSYKEDCLKFDNKEAIETEVNE